MEIELLVHHIADAIVHNECGVFSPQELRQLATNLIIAEDPEMVLRKTIDRAVKASPVQTLQCPVAKRLIKHHNLMVRQEMQAL